VVEFWSACIINFKTLIISF